MGLHLEFSKVIAGVAVGLLHSLITHPPPSSPLSHPAPSISAIECKCACDCHSPPPACPSLSVQPLVCLVGLLVLISASLGFRLGRSLPARVGSPARVPLRLATPPESESDSEAASVAAVRAAVLGTDRAEVESPVLNLQEAAVQQVQALRDRRVRRP